MTIYINSEKVFIIWINKTNNYNYFLSCLSHEALHTTVAILKQISVSLHYDTEEVYCYLLQHIMQLCLDNINRTNFLSENNVNNKSSTDEKNE